MTGKRLQPIASSPARTQRGRRGRVGHAEHEPPLEAGPRRPQHALPSGGSRRSRLAPEGVLGVEQVLAGGGDLTQAMPKAAPVGAHVLGEEGGVGQRRLELVEQLGALVREHAHLSPHGAAGPAGEDGGPQP